MSNAVQLRRENERLRRELMRREQELVDRDEQLSAKDEQLSAKDEQLSAKDEQLSAKDEQLAAREKELSEQFQARMEEINRLHEEEIEQLKLEQKLLIERVFAKRSERYVDDPRQLRLDLHSDDAEFNAQVEDAVEGLLIAADEVKQDGTDEDSGKKKRTPRKRGDGKFPEHLVKQVIDVDLSDQDKQGLTHIGYDPVQKLFMKRPEFWVVETRYHKYVDPTKQRSKGVISQPREPREGLVQGDHYDSSVVAELLANRFGYHQPFYRQQDMFAASGWTPSRSTLANLQSSAAQLLAPFYLYLVSRVLADSVIGTDDTGVKLLLPRVLGGIDSSDPKSERTLEVLSQAMADRKSHVNAKMWAYRGVHVPINVFDFTVSRHRDGPDLFLIESGYRGTLMGDCYGANTGIEMRSSGDVVHAACNAHARRGFKEALPTHERHGRFFLSCYHDLYDIEDRGAVMDADARQELRQGEAKPIWDRMRDYISTQTLDLLPKERMRKSINYLLNQWGALTRYLDDPHVPIDNNESEQLMRQIALGRKNWLFVGSVSSGYEMSWLMSIVSSAIRNHVHVSIYLKELIDALLGGSTEYEQLLPDHWVDAHPKHRREYRTVERESKLKRKREQRAIRRILQQSAS